MEAFWKNEGENWDLQNKYLHPEPKDFPKDFLKDFPKDFPKDFLKDFPKDFPKDLFQGFSPNMCNTGDT